MTTDLEKSSKKSRRPPELVEANGNGTFARRHRVSEVRENPARIHFEYAGEPYEAVYNRAVITVQFARLMEKVDDKSEAEHAIELLGVLLLDWDLIQDDGETPLPPSVEEMEKLPNEFLGKLLLAIWDDYRPPETPDADSGSFS